MRLETERLILREWREGDIPDLIEGLCDLRVSQWLAFVPYPYTEQDASKWVRYCAACAAQGDARTAYEFAIERRDSGKVIGGVSVCGISRVHGVAGGGIWIGAKHDGHGYGAEAFGRRIEFAFEELDLRRLENGFYAGNDASRRMQEKFGYRIEGMRRKAYRCMADGQLKDEYITGLLREEWIRS